MDMSNGQALNFIEGLEVTHRQKAKIEDMIMPMGKKMGRFGNV